MADEYVLHKGDCLETMASMESDSVDAIVTDPPYAIAFGGADWDNYGGRNGTESTEERRRKGREYADDNSGAPRFGNSHGKKATLGEMLAFQEAMTPTFTEALRVAKPGAYLLAFGSPRTFHRLMCAIEESGWELRNTIMYVFGSGFPKGQRVERLLGDDPTAKDWVGWNTQLKPSFEPIVVARKALDGTVANNVRTWGTGAVNVDACRVPSDGGQGRYPANLVHDGSDEVLSCFPDSKGQQGDVTGNEPSRPADGVCYGEFNGRHTFSKRGDSGSAARFFYCAKATKADRNLGGVDNDHLSVKPNALMRWLVRLVCRRGGLVLDPFMGSGSTGVACMDEGMRFVGIDLDEHYVDIARRRIEGARARNAQQTLF